MCVVSMIGDHHMQKWPLPQFPNTPMPNSFPTPFTPSGFWITLEQWQEYQDLKRKAVEYDKATNQPDCQKPELDEWERRMEAFLKKKGVLPDPSTDHPAA